MSKLNDITSDIIGAAIDIHRELGPGLLESAYEACLVHDLQSRGRHVQAQTALPVRYRGVEIDCGYRLDLLVDDLVIVELKVVAGVLPIHQAQLLTYLKLSGRRLGLILNFHVARMRDGIHRYVSG